MFRRCLAWLATRLFYMRSTKRLLIEERLGQDLSAYVTDLRQDGTPWTAIATRVSRVSGVEVTHQTLINWFSERLPA